MIFYWPKSMNEDVSHSTILYSISKTFPGGMWLLSYSYFFLIFQNYNATCIKTKVSRKTSQRVPGYPEGEKLLEKEFDIYL